MSIAYMTGVWSNSKQKGTKLLILLAIADHANDEGVSWPGMASLAKKARLKSRLTVLRAIKDICDDGELVIVKHGGPGKTNRYLIPKRLLYKGSISEDTKPEDSSSTATKVVAQQSLDIVAGQLHESSIEPSIKSSVNTSDLFAIIDTYLHQTFNGTYSKIQPVLKIDESPNVITIGVSIPQPSLKAAISSLVAQSSRKKWQVKVINTPAAVTGDNLAAADKARQPYKQAYETAKRGPYNWTREHDELIDALIDRQCTPAGLQFTYSKLSKDQFWAGKVIPFSVIVNNYTTPPAVRPAQPEQCYV